FLLDLQAGNSGDWDVAYVPPEYFAQFEQYVDKYDLLTMAEQGVLKIPPQMVNPTSRDVAGLVSHAGGIAYNPRLVPAEQVPRTWDDLLKPAWQGKKMGLDLRPTALAALVPAWGMDRTLDYARKLAA